MSRVGAFLVVTGVLGLVFAGCSERVAPLVDPPRATSTPLAVEPSTNSGGGGGSFYKPPGWDGVSDVDCNDFDTYAHAQSFFVGTRGSTTNDPYGLDNDHDGTACESLP